MFDPESGSADPRPQPSAKVAAKPPAKPRKKSQPKQAAAKGPAPETSGTTTRRNSAAPRTNASTPAASKSSAAKANRRPRQTGPHLSDWLSLGGVVLLVAASVGLQQWRNEARPAPSAPALIQPASP